MVKYSVVIPIYNEGPSLKELCCLLKKTLDSLKQSYEVIFINDDSYDNSIALFKMAICELDLINFSMVNLMQHYGQSAAMQTGFNLAKGDIIISMDGDLQNNPEDITMLLDKMKEGYSVVCGWRHQRTDPLIKIIPSKLANLMRRFIFRERIHDVGCSLRAYSKLSLKDINLSGQKHRFLTAILKKQGFEIAEVKIQHFPRRYGKTKYGILERIIKSMPDLLEIIFLGPNPGGRKKCQIVDITTPTS